MLSIVFAKESGSSLSLCVCVLCGSGKAKNSYNNIQRGEGQSGAEQKGVRQGISINCESEAEQQQKQKQKQKLKLSSALSVSIAVSLTRLFCLKTQIAILSTHTHTLGVREKKEEGNLCNTSRAACRVASFFMRSNNF